MRDSLILHQENNPLPPASPYALPSERAVINCGLVLIQMYELEAQTFYFCVLPVIPPAGGADMRTSDVCDKTELRM